MMGTAGEDHASIIMAESVDADSRACCVILFVSAISMQAHLAPDPARFLFRRATLVLPF